MGRSLIGGFSLAELLVSVFILGLMVSVGVLGFGTSVSKEQSRGLAYQFGAELRTARATAMQGEKFVAVCIPNDGGGNPFSRSFAVRGGYDADELIRTVNLDDDLSATIFTGRWAGDTLESFDETPDWVRNGSNEYRLVFRPDGTAFSEDLAELNGRYNFVVASRMAASGDSLSAATNPTTIWVSKAGTVGMLENALPSGTLPPASELPAVAKLDPASTSGSDRDPRIVGVDFLPVKVEELPDVGLGQTAVQIHPQQKLPGMGQNGVEYGLTTFRFRATDPDGGPLRFNISCEASAGEPGNFSYVKTDSALGPSTGGQMDFVQTDEGNWVWESVISWRPPPGAALNTEYDFNLKVEDPQGNAVEMASGAELLPRIVLLRPENLVYETSDGQLIMTNLDGTSHRRLTKSDEPESNPFFSSDGTRLYSFFDSPSELAVITRNSDGTQRKRLQSFPLSDFRKLTFDPFKSYAAYLAGSSQYVDAHYQVVKSKTVTITLDPPDPNTGATTEEVTVYYLEDGPPNHLKIDHLEVMHLNSGKKVTISDHAKENFKWYGHPRFGLSYSETELYDEDDKVAPPAQDPRAVAQGLAENLPKYIPSPGYKNADNQVIIKDYPPRAESATLPALPTGLEFEVFNLARPRYYLECANTTPSLTFHDNSGTLPNRVLVNPRVQSPSWSSDGRYVLYARENGGEVSICRQRVLNDTLDDLQMGGEEVLYSSDGVKTPQLSSSGQYAFFLKGGDIFRIEVDDPSTPVNITRKLSPSVKTFVLSP